jgi:hypothetical protein
MNDESINCMSKILMRNSLHEEEEKDEKNKEKRNRIKKNISTVYAI